MRACVIAILAACGGGRPSAPVPQSSTPGVPQRAAAPAMTSPTNTFVEVKVTRAASRQPASPRILRRILAARRGVVELPNEAYLEVGLMIEAVTSGTLDDPNYAKRPIGTNHLSVILVDEAAHASPDSLDGFEGNWRLTRLDDGTYVASAIEDTPFPRASVANRRQLINQVRKDLRSPHAVNRLRALQELEERRIFELVYDIIPLLDDDRVEGRPAPPSSDERGQRVVGDEALALLSEMFEPLEDPKMPRTRSPDAWSAFWAEATTRNVAPPAIVPTVLAEIETLPMPQSLPVLAALPGSTYAYGVDRLEPPIDGNADGLVINKAGKRTWIVKYPVEGLDAAGSALLFAGYDTWRMVFGSTPVELPRPHKNATHAALAANDRTFLVASITGRKALHVLAIDANGRPGASRDIALPNTPSAGYHKRVFPIAVARKSKGWLVAVETNTEVLLVNLDDKLALVGTTKLDDADNTKQPRIAVGSDRVFVAWKRRERDMLATVVTDLAGKPISRITTSASEVQQTPSKPIALEDGFAMAWVEAVNVDELHVGKWNRAGERVADVVIARGASPFALTLTRDHDRLVVGFQDNARYPYKLVSRSLALSDLR